MFTISKQLLQTSQLFTLAVQWTGNLYRVCLRPAQEG